MADDLALAHRLADVADDITAARFTSRDFTVGRKADGSEVTDADVQVEEALRAIVAEQRPRDSFLSEELGLHEREASRTWIVDGIDGTRSFVAGTSTWGTLIALQEHGHILVGVASSPGLRARWWAARGQGAWTGHVPSGDPRHARRLGVSAQESRDQVRAVMVPPLADLRGWRHESARRVLDVVRPSPIAGHGPLLVAAGDIEASVHLGGGPWDHAPFVVLVQEAGGRFSDLWGGRRIDTGTAVFTNGPAHEDIRLLARIPAPPAPETPGTSPGPRAGGREPA